MSNEARDADLTKSVDTPPEKKQKTDAVAEAEAEVEPEFRLLRKANSDDSEYMKQLDIFAEQFEKSEGYDVDWENLYYNFIALKFEWSGKLSREHTNKELMNLLIQTAIEEENEENESNLEFVKYVSANVVAVQGFMFYITFWAKDVSSPNPEPKLYQAKVRRFMGEIFVSQFRLRPSQEL